ncbi:MAG TPA: hypothetical protein PKH54_04625 [Myxococcota bacterium]|nr:hypothetical protein [Myxococcota bacterium]HPV03761.1 hypothetical protein [Myxococcota bacterium]
MKKSSFLFLSAIITVAATIQGCGGATASGDTIVDNSPAELPDQDAQDVHASDPGAVPDVSDVFDENLPEDGLSETHSDAVTDIIIPDPISTIGAFRFDNIEATSGQKDLFTTLLLNERHVTAVNRCGLMGIVFNDVVADGLGGFVSSLVFSEVNLSSPPGEDELVSRVTLRSFSASSSPARHMATLAYESDCTPIVIVQTEDGFQFTQVGGGQITFNELDDDTDYQDIESLGARVGLDKKIHMMFRARPGAGATMQFFDATFNGSGFDVVAMPNPDTALVSTIDAAAGNDGRAVVCYLKDGTDGQEVWVARFNGTTWDRERVAGVVPSQLRWIAFTIGSYGRESIAWANVATNDEGLILSVDLKHTYRDLDKTFKTEAVAFENNGYQGGGGKRFTGALPRILVDGSGRPHILFSDIAIETSGTSQTILTGQLRYAWRRNMKWNETTIFEQTPDQDGKDAFIEFRDFGTSPDGTAAGIAALEVVASDSTFQLSTIGISVVNVK